MKKRNLLTVLFVLTILFAQAQSFAPAFAGFSPKKLTKITKEDGTVIEGRIRVLMFKKGLISKITVKDANDLKVKLLPTEIKFMYVPPSAMAVAAQKMEALTDLKKLQDGELNTDYLTDGYVYMEKSKVDFGKKQGEYMLQVVNPTFSLKIKIYNDPYAKESMSVGVGPMKLAGGLEKSYYMKKAGEDVAHKITKKDYKREMSELFSECPELLKKYGENPKWSEFEKFIYEYSTSCK